MFQQEVNLYKSFDEPEPPFSLLNWRVVMASNLIVASLLSIICLYSYISMIYMHKNLVFLQAQASNMQNQFYALKKRYPEAFFNQDAEKSVQKLDQVMQEREKLLQQLTNQTRFSDDLEALSQVIIPDVWLTAITINKNGDEVTLKGKSMSSAKMQEFLTKLTSYKLYKNYSLSVKDIEDNKQTAIKGDLIFELLLVKNSL